MEKVGVSRSKMQKFTKNKSDFFKFKRQYYCTWLDLYHLLGLPFFEAIQIGTGDRCFKKLPVEMNT